MIESYAILLYGSVDECKRQVVAKIKSKRIEYQVSLEDLNEILESALFCCQGENPTVEGVEADPQKLTPEMVAAICISLGLGADSLFWEKLEPFLQDPDNVRKVLDNAKRRDSVESEIFTDHARALHYVTFSIIGEFSEKVLLPAT